MHCSNELAKKLAADIKAFKTFMTQNLKENLLTSPKLFLGACFHNLPEEHALHNADFVLESLCPVIQNVFV